MNYPSHRTPPAAVISLGSASSNLTNPVFPNYIQSNLRSIEQALNFQSAGKLDAMTARQLYNTVIYQEHQHRIDCDSAKKTADQTSQKISALKTQLENLIEPGKTASSSNTAENSNNPTGKITHPETAISSDSRIQKQKYFVELIDSLLPEGDMNAIQAKIRYDHIVKLYEAFFSNQTEIVTNAKGDFLREQIDLGKEIQSKVLNLQYQMRMKFEPIVSDQGRSVTPESGDGFTFLQKQDSI